MDATTIIETRSFKRGINVVIVGVLAYALSVVGLGFRHGPTLSVVWPAASILVGLFVRLPSIARWESFLVTGLAFYAADSITGSHAGHALVSAIANIVFVVSGWYFLTTARPIDRQLGRPQSVAVVYIIAAIAALVSGGSALVFESLLGTEVAASTVLEWTIVSFSNAALVLPVILTAPAWQRVKIIPTEPRRHPRDSEALVPLLLMALLGFGIYVHAPTAVTFAVPALIFAALRSGVFKTAVLGLVTLGVMLGAIMLGIGDFEIDNNHTEADAVVVIQLSLALMVMGPIAVASSTTMRNQKLYLAQRQAELDGLTGIFTRRAFFERSELLLQHLAEVKRPVTVAMVDLDNFKVINDNYGHAIGDLVLQDVVTVMKTHLRDTDVFGRVGGDELAIVRAGISCDSVKHIAEGMCAQVASLNTLSGQNLLAAGQDTSGTTRLAGISISVGIVCQETASRSLSELLEQADQALYEAKQSKNTVVVHKVA